MIGNQVIGFRAFHFDAELTGEHHIQNVFVIVGLIDVILQFAVVENLRKSLDNPESRGDAVFAGYR